MVAMEWTPKRERLSNKSRFANSKFRLFFVAFFGSLFSAKKGRFTGLNFGRFAKQNRPVLTLTFRGIKGGGTPSFQAGMGILLRSKMYVIPTACSICFLMLG